MILWSTTDHATLNIYSTITTTKYRIPTLMHDHTYRMGICWQNTAYNQPPHLGYYLPDYVDGKLPTAVPSVAVAQQQTERIFDLQGRRLNSLKPGLNIIRVNGKTKKVFY